MKKKIFAFALVVITVLSSVSFVFAENERNQEYIEDPKGVYYALSESERHQFDYVIATNENLQAYHLENVDACFDAQKVLAKHELSVHLSAQNLAVKQAVDFGGNISINSARVETRTFDNGYILLCASIGSLGLASSVEYAMDALSAKLDTLRDSSGNVLTSSR